MIKTALALVPIVVGVAFAAGCYVGWKTTLKALETTRKQVA